MEIDEQKRVGCKAPASYATDWELPQEEIRQHAGSFGEATERRHREEKRVLRVQCEPSRSFESYRRSRFRPNPPKQMSSRPSQSPLRKRSFEDFVELEGASSKSSFSGDFTITEEYVQRDPDDHIQNRQLKKLKKQLTDLHQEIGRIEAENHELRADRADVQTKNKMLQARQETLTQELRDQGAQLDQTMRENARLKQERDSLRRKLLRYEKRDGGLGSSHDETQEDSKTLHSQASIHASQI